MTRFYRFSILTAILLVILAGCGQSNGGDSTSEENDFPRGISVGSATLGGTFHVYATGWSDMITDVMGVSTNVEATNGPLDNISLVNNGEIDVGLVTMGMASEGYEGIEWTDESFENIRGLFPMYTSYLHYFSVPSADISSIEDMDGAIIGTGASGGTPDYYNQRLFEELDIEPNNIVHSSFEDYANQMRDGQMHAASSFSPSNHPTISEMIQTDDVEVFGVGEDSEMLAEQFNISTGTMEAGSYENQEEDIETLTTISAFIVSNDLSNEFVYALLEETFNNQETLEQAHSTGSELSLDMVDGEFFNLPLHPGAVEYYEDQGVEIPEEALPPEMEG